ncbi:hypothetical protein PBI_STANNES_78 [Mycobacterium phage StAnnes]|nr:hypothetical protein PBI_STANNES_78 [Mycobacterium phage StAnnes]
MKPKICGHIYCPTRARSSTLPTGRRTAAQQRARRDDTDRRQLWRQLKA